MIWIFNLFAFLSLDDITYNQINLAVTCGLAPSSADLLTLWPFQCSISVVRNIQNVSTTTGNDSSSSHHLKF